MGHHVVIGAGTIGSALATRLARAGHDVAVVSQGRPSPATGVTTVALEAADPTALAKLARGADVLYNCASHPGDQHVGRDGTAVAVSALEAATSSGAVLVTL